MGKPGKRNEIAGILRLGAGYSLGFLAWLSGIYCLYIGEKGSVGLSNPRLLKHLSKVFLWTLWLLFLLRSLAWIREADGYGTLVFILLLPMLFLFLKLLFSRFFWIFLPGFHVFLCPQCFQSQVFRFQPVSFRFGFFVTYLCPYCSCLVNAWGEQILFPLPVSFVTVLPRLGMTVFFSAGTVAAAVGLSHALSCLL